MQLAVNNSAGETLQSIKNSSISAKGKYLTFVIGEAEYGIEILKVREIIGIMPISPIPKSDFHLKGVINLRDTIIPIFDLRLIFGMQEKEYNSETCIIIVDVKGKQAGVIVDTVSEVMNVNEGEVETSGNIEEKVKASFILGISKVQNKIRVLVDIDAILKNENLSF